MDSGSIGIETYKDIKVHPGCHFYQGSSMVVPLVNLLTLLAGFRFFARGLSGRLTGEPGKIGSAQGPPEIKPGPIDRHQFPTFPAHRVQYFRGLLGQPPNKYAFIFESGHPAHPLANLSLKVMR
jgi:hypothetical protein